ncbi:MAG: hypothetical protein RLY93_12410 [Sumerlaeia bacterium]
MKRPLGRAAALSLAALLFCAAFAGCAATTEAGRIRASLATDSARDLEDAAAELDKVFEQIVAEEAREAYGQLEADYRAALAQTSDPLQAAVLTEAYVEGREQTRQRLVTFGNRLTALSANVRLGAEATRTIDLMASNEIEVSRDLLARFGEPDFQDLFEAALLRLEQEYTAEKVAGELGAGGR